MQVSSQRAELHIMWVCMKPLAQSLDSATWLATTQQLRKLGVHVALVAVGPTGRHEIEGVEVICFSRPDVYIVRQLVFHFRVICLALKEWKKTDVILFHQASAPWLAVLRLIRFLTGDSKPLLALDTRTLHMPPADLENLKDKVRARMYRLSDGLANSWADGRLAITRRMAETERIPPAKLWGVWPSGAELERFDAAQSARRWPAPGEPIRLIYAGCLHHERNLVTLSRAVVQAQSEGLLFRLSLVGDGTARRDLESFAATTDGIITVEPPVPHSQVPSILASAHVGVLPFPDEEKFRVSSPVKLFEYMAAGLPVLATRIACHTEVVGDVRCVIWAADSDVPGLLAGLRLLWSNRGDLEEMGRQAAILARQWTWQKSARMLKAALERGVSQCA